MAMSNDHDSFLAAKKTGACSSRQIHNNSAQTYAQSGRDGGKKIPLYVFVCCEFSAGVWMVVVGEFTTAIKPPLLHNNSAYLQYNLTY